MIELIEVNLHRMQCVLSVFFGLLTLWAYAHYVESPGWKRYLGVAGAFALSLLCKPMLMTLPVLILHGTADKVTKPEGSQLFFDTAGSKDKTLKLYDGHAHDLLNDVDKETVMADITGWINAHLPTRS